ncbi:hypothetical protein B2G71_20315 [Novosphingobium sp. PC22D]|uniref:hypothetical protein n=1 Tax=Novosphingobium sp. PC22D TaxID=1962403 RepID=UPI000BEFBE47|nr:hypothetical protein [Novosphingobium sp. PC22D]PEQ10812.1 hypothetical protein B2G71_20315 [Novosphingobium sp. PC22D]
MSRKRRALVLCDETAKHHYLRSLPPHVRRVGVSASVANSADARVSASVANSADARVSAASDWRTFLAVYCVGFVAVSAFIV